MIAVPNTNGGCCVSLRNFEDDSVYEVGSFVLLLQFAQITVVLSLFWRENRNPIKRSTELTYKIGIVRHFVLVANGIITIMTLCINKKHNL